MTYNQRVKLCDWYTGIILSLESNHRFRLATIVGYCREVIARRPGYDKEELRDRVREQLEGLPEDQQVVLEHLQRERDSLGIPYERE